MEMPFFKINKAHLYLHQHHAPAAFPTALSAQVKHSHSSYSYHCNPYSVVPVLYHQMSLLVSQRAKGLPKQCCIVHYGCCWRQHCLLHSSHFSTVVVISAGRCPGDGADCFADNNLATGCQGLAICCCFPLAETENALQLISKYKLILCTCISPFCLKISPVLSSLF